MTTSPTAVARTGNAHLEANLEAFFVKRVRLVGGYAFKWTPTVAGVPDRMVLMPDGQTFFVELKQKGAKPSAIQVVWHERLKEIGHRVYVIDSKEKVVSWLAEIVDASGPKRRKPGPAPKA